MGLPVVGRDLLNDGQGYMKIKLAGLLAVVNIVDINLTEQTAAVKEYKNINRINIPGKFKISWNLEDSIFTWYKFEIYDMRYDNDLSNQFSFKISSFVRDVQMNPSIISSKSFVVSASDFQKLKLLGESEYQIAFQLNDLAQLLNNNYCIIKKYIIK